MIPMYSYPGPGAMRRVLRRILTPLVCGAFLLAGCSKDLADEPGRVPADPEPPAADSPLNALPNVFLTPHIAGSKGREVERMGAYMAEECARWLSGAPTPYEVTLPMLETMA